jgi:hypothetical protein
MTTDQQLSTHRHTHLHLSYSLPLYLSRSLPHPLLPLAAPCLLLHDHAPPASSPRHPTPGPPPRLSLDSDARLTRYPATLPPAPIAAAPWPRPRSRARPLVDTRHPATDRDQIGRNRHDNGQMPGSLAGYRDLARPLSTALLTRSEKRYRIACARHRAHMPY